MAAQARCIVCECTRLTEIHRLPIGTVLGCTECTLAMLWKSDLSDLVMCTYDGSYYAAGEASRVRGYADYAGAERWIRVATAEAMVNIVSAHCTGSKLLDVGCGAGYLVAAAQRQGFNAYGIDPSTAAIELAVGIAESSFLTAESLEAHEARMGPHSYDVVVMFDVVEHLPDPTSALASAIRLLSRDGRLLVTTPRFGGWLYRSQRADYIQFKTDHVAYFNESALARLAENATTAPWQMTTVQHALRDIPRVSQDVLQKYNCDRDTLLLVIGPT